MEIVEVTTFKQLKEFINLPFILHRGHRRWVPPLVSDEKVYFSKRKNPAFQKNDVILLILYENQKLVGRIMGIINHSYNKLRNERNVRFCYLECPNDIAVAGTLMNKIESWGKANGMNKIVGPLGFSDQDPEGFLIEGFEYEPTLSTYYNFEYIPNILDNLGYEKEIDYVVYSIDLTQTMMPSLERIFNRVISRGELRFLEFNSKKELKPFVKPIMYFMNDTFKELYGFQPMQEDEIDFLVKRFLPIINPRFIKAASKDGNLVGFLLAIPNLNEGFIRCEGRLLPFGILHLVRAAGKTKQLDLLAGGVKKEYRGQGIETLGLISVIRSAKNAGMKLLDSHHELENNIDVRRVMEHFNGKLIKRFRIYKKIISN
jgi:hypothetical protein